MKIGFSIKESVNQIDKGILNRFTQDIKQDFSKGIRKVKQELPYLIHKIVVSSPTYGSLLSGELHYELGIPDAEQKILRLINKWTSNIRYRVRLPKVQGNRIVAYFDASMFRTDFSEVIGTPEAQVYDVLRGYELPWLRWLVFYGNIPIIPDFHVEMKNSPRSRTGRALMMPGRSWSVPPRHAGTMADNWITRAIASNSSQIDRLLEGAFN